MSAYVSQRAHSALADVGRLVDQARLPGHWSAYAVLEARAGVVARVGDPDALKGLLRALAELVDAVGRDRPRLAVEAHRVAARVRPAILPDYMGG